MGKVKEENAANDIKRFVENLPLDFEVIERYLDGEVCSPDISPKRSLRNENETYHRNLYIKFTHDARCSALNNLESYARQKKLIDEKRAKLKDRLAQAEGANSQGGGSQKKPWTPEAKRIFWLICCGLVVLMIFDAFINYTVCSALMPEVAMSPMFGLAISVVGAVIAFVLKFVENFLQLGSLGKKLYRGTLLGIFLVVVIAWLHSMLLSTGGGELALMNTVSYSQASAGSESSLKFILQMVIFMLAITFMGLFAIDYWNAHHHGTSPDTVCLEQLKQQLEMLDAEFLVLSEKEGEAGHIISVLDHGLENFVSKSDAELVARYFLRARKGALK